jgi:hypothetical protein
MEIYGLGVFIPGDTIHTTIQSAVDAAHRAPGGAVWIPAYYTGADSYTNTNRVPIFDMRSNGTITAGTVSGSGAISGAPATPNTISINGATVTQAQAAAAAQVSGLTGGIFVTTLNALGRVFSKAGPSTSAQAGTLPSHQERIRQS